MSSGVRVKQPQTYVRIARAQRRIGNSIRLGAHMTCQTTQPSSLLSDKAKERKCLDRFLVGWQRTVVHLDLARLRRVGILLAVLGGTLGMVSYLSHERNKFSAPCILGPS